MLKKTVTYTDFNGNKTSEDLYFHLSKSEMIDMELDESGSMSDRLKRIQQTRDSRAMYREMKEIILRAYGKKSEDGRRFIKNQEIREEFESSAAYDEFVFGLFRNTDEIVNFVNGIIPQDQIQEALKEAEARKHDLSQSEDPQAQEAARKLEEAKAQFETSQKEENQDSKSNLSPEEVSRMINENPDLFKNHLK